MTDLDALERDLNDTLQAIEDGVILTRDQRVGFAHFANADDVANLDKQMLINAKLFLTALYTFRFDRGRMNKNHKIGLDRTMCPDVQGWND